MKTNLTHNDKIIQELLLILFNQLEPAKFLDIVTTLNLGSQGDYMKLKEQLFKNETIDSIYEEAMKERENQDIHEPTQTTSPNDQELIEKVLVILQKQLPPIDFLRFVTTFNLGKGDYLAFKNQLQENENVESLCQKIDEYENKQNLKFKLLDVVALLEDLPQLGLYRGQVGTIVEVYEPTVFQVEFSDTSGRAYAIETLQEKQLMLLHHSPLEPEKLTANA